MLFLAFSAGLDFDNIPFLYYVPETLDEKMIKDFCKGISFSEEFLQ
jgi:hypothetical protein